MKLRNKRTGKIVELEKILFKNAQTEDLLKWKTYEPNVNSLAELSEEWEDYKPAEPQIADESVRAIIKSWYGKNNLVGKLRSYGGKSWLGLRGSDEDGNDWKIELHVDYNSQLKDDELYSLTELIGEKE